MTMTSRRTLAIATILLFLTGVWFTVELKKEETESPNLIGALQLWTDVFQDLDRLRFRRVGTHDNREVELGALLAKTFDDKLVHDERLQAYIDGVGATLAAHVIRKTIPYRFHIVDAPSANAFALPGGQVYVTRQMLELLETEAELAGVLARQIADIDLGYTNDRFQDREQLQNFSSGDPIKIAQFTFALISSGRPPLSKAGGSQDMESHAVTLIAQARYHPKHLIAFEDRMREFQEATKSAKAPPKFILEELSSALSTGLESYLTANEPSGKRMAELLRSLAKNESSWAEKQFYSGRSNHADRMSRTDSERTAEWRAYEEPPAYQPYLGNPRYAAFKAIATDLTSGMSGIAGNQATPEEAVETAISECGQKSPKCVIYALGDHVVLGKTKEELEEEKAFYFNAVCMQKPSGAAIGGCGPIEAIRKEAAAPNEAVRPLQERTPDDLVTAPTADRLNEPESKVEKDLLSFLKGSAIEARFALTDVSFDPGTASLTQGSLSTLERTARLLVQFPTALITIGVERERAEMRVSRALTTARAVRVQEGLIRGGVALSRISIGDTTARKRYSAGGASGTGAGVWIGLTKK